MEPTAALDVRFLPFPAAIDERVTHTIHGATVSRWSLCGLKLGAIWVRLHILLSTAMEDWPLLYLSSRWSETQDKCLEQFLKDATRGGRVMKWAFVINEPAQSWRGSTLACALACNSAASKCSQDTWWWAVPSGCYVVSGSYRPAVEWNTMCATSGWTFLLAPWSSEVIHAALIPTVMPLSWGAVAPSGPPRYRLWPPRWRALHLPCQRCHVVVFGRVGLAWEGASGTVR